MLAIPISIIVSVSGQVFGLRSSYYARTVRKTGQVIVQRKPRRTKPPTAAQLAARQRFAARYAGSHRPSLSGSHRPPPPPPPPSQPPSQPSA